MVSDSAVCSNHIHTNNLRKGRYAEATKRPFLSLIDSRGPARSGSGPGWAWTDTDHLVVSRKLV